MDQFPDLILSVLLCTVFLPFRYLVPRFQPWAQHALTAFKQHRLPAGSIIVPACGPGNLAWQHELCIRH